MVDCFIHQSSIYSNECLINYCENDFIDHYIDYCMNDFINRIIDYCMDYYLYLLIKHF